MLPALPIVLTGRPMRLTVLLLRDGERGGSTLPTAGPAGPLPAGSAAVLCVAVRGMKAGARGGAGHRGCQGLKGVPAGAKGQERGTDRPYTTQGCPKSRWPGVCRCRSHRHTGSPPTAVRGILQLGNMSVL
jgi:hypothetical protein